MAKNGKVSLEGVIELKENTTIQILGNVRATIPASEKFTIAPIDLTSFAIKEYASDGKNIDSFKGAVRGIATTVKK